MKIRAGQIKSEAADAGDVLTADGAGNAVFIPGGSGGALDDLSDVSVPTPNDGDVLTYNEYGEWVAEPPTGGAGDAADLTYTPAVDADWDGSADPGNADSAFDQLAERVKDIELSAGVGGGAGNFQVDQSGGTGDTHGILAGARNGANVEFITSKSEYNTGTLSVYLNGQLLTQGSSEDWHEDNPATGKIHFTEAPIASDEITVIYSYGVIAGFGDVIGPANNTANSVPQWNGANSKTLKDGLAIVTTVGSPGSDSSLPTEQGVREAITAIVPTYGEGHLTFFPLSYSSIGQGDWAMASNTLSLYSWYLKQTNPGNGDNVSYKAYMDAGTYTMMLIHHKNNVAGIMDIYIDATEIGSIDLYAALTWNVRATITGISIATAGLKTIKFQIDGHNGATSSPHYTGYIVYFALWRTA